MGANVTGVTPSQSKYRRTEYIKSTQSWTAPSNVNRVEVILCGGGGGGKWVSNIPAQSHAGGGSVTYDSFAVTPGQSYTITIGAGGSGGGSDGGSSSFGALLTISGGRGADSYRPGPGQGIGLGGTGSPGPTGYQDESQRVARMRPGRGAFGLGGGGGAVYNSGLGNSRQGEDGGGSSFSPNGVQNTGGGGGVSFGSAGAGGSGVCIISYWS